MLSPQGRKWLIPQSAQSARNLPWDPRVVNDAFDTRGGGPYVFNMDPKVRILVAKPGLDGHDRGVKVIARALRDGGFEVLYTGLHQTPEQIVTAALQEDVDAIGVSVMSGAHMTLIPRILDALAKERAGDILLFAGGIIPAADAATLKALGVREVFTPGTSTDAVVTWARAHVPPKTLGAASQLAAEPGRRGG